EVALKWGNEQREQAAGGQMGLFGDMEVAPPEVVMQEPHSRLELLAMEKDSLGLYISDHPMSSYPGLANAASCNVAAVERWFRKIPATELKRGRARVALAGILQRVSKRLT